jgi:hypothetical protein
MLERMRLNVQRYEPMFVVGEPVPPPGGFEHAEWEAMVATITIASSPEVLAVIDEAHAKFASFRERGSLRASIARIAMASARHDRHPHALDLGDERAAVVGEPRDLQQRPARHRNDVTDDTRWRRVHDTERAARVHQPHGRADHAHVVHGGSVRARAASDLSR